VIPSEKKADAAAVSTVPEAPPPPAADVYLPITEVTQMPVLPWKKIRSQLVYPQAARNLGLEGTVVLELTLTADGEIRDIRVLTDPGHGFADAAVAALRGQFASPAFLGDDPVAVRYRVPVKFTLTD
jgi:protein TonB